MSSKNVEGPKVDFVLVTDKNKIIHLVEYIRTLETLGLRFQMVPEQGGDELLFLKIIIPPDVVKNFANVYGLNIQHRKHFLLHSIKLPTDTPDVLEVKKEDGVANSAERISLIHKLLEVTPFKSGEIYGLSALIHNKIVRAAYPLHDGEANWNQTNKPLNDRQLLYKHWANLGVWYKQQPLDLIEKYYGAEVAFYFAWMGFYNRMLIIASIFGSLCFFASFIQYFTRDTPLIEDICNNKLYMCPPCSTARFCHFRQVSRNCLNAKLGSIFDSYPTVIFAVFMAFWSRMFLTLWKRREYELKIRWNMQFEDIDTTYRLEYKMKASRTKLSKLSGQEEPYVSMPTKYFHLTITLATCSFLIFLVFLTILCVMYFKMMFVLLLINSGNFFLANQAKNIAIVTGGIIQVCFMRLFGKFYGKVSIWLTNMENPRTQLEYDNSYMYKSFFLAFVNFYSAFFYAAFVKGRYYTSPDKLGSMNAFQRDSCSITCLVELNINLVILFLCKKLVGLIIVYFVPKIKKLCRWRVPPAEELPQWEMEKKLGTLGRYHITSEINEMVIEYGCVICFAASFPLTPLMALFNNCFELRLDAFKLVKRLQRPVPRKCSGIGSWNGVLLGLTYLSTVTNGFIIAFTSHFVHREMFMYRNGPTLVGFVNTTLSSFATKDFDVYMQIDNVPKVCYYEGSRFPHDHEFKYKTTPDYWILLTWRFICVLVFEHILMIVTGTLAYAIPNIPTAVIYKLNMNRIEEKEIKLKLYQMNRQKKDDKKPDVVQVDNVVKHVTEFQPRTVMGSEPTLEA